MGGLSSGKETGSAGRDINPVWGFSLEKKAGSSGMGKDLGDDFHQ